MGANLDLLKELFPRRAMLSVDEVAEILALGGAGGSYEQTRRELKEGRVIPGLRKMDGICECPSLRASQAKRQPTPQTSEAPSTFGSRGRRPDALRACIERFFSQGNANLLALPPTEPAPVSAPQFTDDQVGARKRYERAHQRASEFCEVVGSHLSARDLEFLPPATNPPRTMEMR